MNFECGGYYFQQCRAAFYTQAYLTFLEYSRSSQVGIYPHSQPACMAVSYVYIQYLDLGYNLRSQQLLGQLHVLILPACPVLFPQPPARRPFPFFAQPIPPIFLRTSFSSLVGVRVQESGDWLHISLNCQCVHLFAREFLFRPRVYGSRMKFGACHGPAWAS